MVGHGADHLHHRPLHLQRDRPGQSSLDTGISPFSLPAPVPFSQPLKGASHLGLGSSYPLPSWQLRGLSLKGHQNSAVTKTPLGVLSLPSSPAVAPPEGTARSPPPGPLRSSSAFKGLATEVYMMGAPMKTLRQARGPRSGSLCAVTSLPTIPRGQGDWGSHPALVGLPHVLPSRLRLLCLFIAMSQY